LPPAEKPIAPPRDAGPAPQVTERLPRVPTEAQVRAARPPAPPSIMLAPTTAPSREPTQALREPEPEDSPPTAEETAPQAPTESAAPAPALPTTPSPAAAPAAPPPSRVAANIPPASGYLIQIAAVREEDRAAAEWARLQRQHSDALQGLKLFVIKADLGDKGVFWRLRAGPFADEAQAKNRCADLAKRKVGCLVVKAEG